MACAIITAFFRFLVINRFAFTTAVCHRIVAFAVTAVFSRVAAAILTLAVITMLTHVRITAGAIAALGICCAATAFAALGIFWAAINRCVITAMLAGITTANFAFVIYTTFTLARVTIILAGIPYTTVTRATILVVSFAYPVITALTADSIAADKQINMQYNPVRCAVFLQNPVLCTTLGILPYVLSD